MNDSDSDGDDARERKEQCDERKAEFTLLSTHPPNLHTPFCLILQLRGLHHFFFFLL